MGLVKTNRLDKRLINGIRVTNDLILEIKELDSILNKMDNPCFSNCPIVDDVKNKWKELEIPNILPQ